MTASSKAPSRLSFTLQQTPASRKSFQLPVGLKSELKRGARLVANTEFPSIPKFVLSVILTSDEELLAMNQSSLGHDWYTDILTFEIERSADRLEAELYLSVDRARENAKRAHVSLPQELVHLVLHGVLHLAGYDDKVPKAQNQMRARERFYLANFQPL